METRHTIGIVVVAALAAIGIGLGTIAYISDEPLAKRQSVTADGEIGPDVPTHPDTPLVGDPVSPDEPDPPEPAPEPPQAAATIDEPSVAPAAPARDSLPVARMIRGLAEVEVSGGRYAPADYMRVVLKGARTFEAWTGRQGEFFFEDVPAGRYVLEFQMASRERRTVYRSAVAIQPGARVELPPVHIPIDSLAGWN